VLTLALGIGATTAIFSVVHAVLLRSLGWGEETKLATIGGNFASQNLLDISVSAMEYQDLKRARFLSTVGVYTDRNAALQGDPAERVMAGYATGTFFSALGVQPLYGRNFVEAEDKDGNQGVALLSYSTFRKRYGADPSVVGRSVTLNGLPRTIVGVLPPAFQWDAPNEYWLPFGFSPAELSNQRGNRYLAAVARLAPGVSWDQAKRGLADLSATIRQENPKWYGHAASSWYLTMAPLRDRFVGSARQPLLVLLGAVLLVLLIACGNVANLLLARGAARSREIAVRSALGAGRGQVVRQLLTESALLGVLGTVAGVVLSAWLLDALLAAAPQAIQQLANVRVSRALLVFAAGMSLVTTLIFGLVPALQATRPALADALKDGAHGSSSPRAARLRSALVAAQVALSLLLLIGAGLLLRSFAEVMHVAPGFDPEGVIAARVSLAGPAYQKDEPQERYWAEAIRRVAALPGVESAGAVSIAPLEDRSDWSYTIEGWAPPTPDSYPDDEFRRATPGYFRALRINVKSGREFTEADDGKGPYVAMVNEAWVRRFFPGQDVIGKRIRFGDKEDNAFNRWRTIVGVAADTHDFGVDKPSPVVFYMPEAQLPDSQMTVLARVAGGGNPAALASAVRAALAGVDPAQPVDWVEPFVARIDKALAPRRFPLQLLGAFAALALLLSAVGIYGVTAYSVTQRTREIGVRIAVGAQARDVVRLVMGGAMRLAAAGVGIGLLGALAATRLLSAQLYGISAHDPLTYLFLSLLLAAVALLASLLPALRATRVDPMSALRAD
jgi:putative ABC transport system permease protein